MDLLEIIGLPMIPLEPARVPLGILISANPVLKHFVKNRISNPTTVKIGQDQYRIDVTNYHQENALQEGCCERE